MFEREYGPVHPDIHQGTLPEVLSVARDVGRIVLVYLHSAIHDDTPRFCRFRIRALAMVQSSLCEAGPAGTFLTRLVFCRSPFCRSVLSSATIAEFVSSNFIFWAGDVMLADAFTLCGSLGISTFPALAAFSVEGQDVTLLKKIEGAMTVDSLFEQLLHLVENFRGAGPSQEGGQGSARMYVFLKSIFLGHSRTHCRTDTQTHRLGRSDVQNMHTSTQSYAPSLSSFLPTFPPLV